VSDYQARAWRRSMARGWATGLFAAAVITALLAVWLWNPQWLATAGVLLFAALVAAIVATP
jgi:hypothetical protein